MITKINHKTTLKDLCLTMFEIAEKLQETVKNDLKNHGYSDDDLKNTFCGIYYDGQFDYLDITFKMNVPKNCGLPFEYKVFKPFYDMVLEAGGEFDVDSLKWNENENIEFNVQFFQPLIFNLWMTQSQSIPKCAN